MADENKTGERSDSKMGRPHFGNSELLGPFTTKAAKKGEKMASDIDLFSLPTQEMPVVP